MNPDKLFDYLDGKLSPAERTQLEEKLMSDPQLRKQFNIAREIHRAGGGSREVTVESEDAAAIERSGKLGRRIATGAAVLVFLNVAIGLAVIVGKNKKSELNTKEASIREQLVASLGAAAQNAMPPPSFSAEEMKITAPRAEWETIAERIIAGATAFGGSAAKGLPDDAMMTVIVDIPSIRDAEFRQALSSAAKITPMPAIAPGTREETAGSNEKNERTIVQVRISETA
jgi:anti-sigma factor RsiW